MELEFGYLYRITPIDLRRLSNNNSSYVYYERDRQLSGFGITAGINFNIQIIKSTIYFSNLIRYDHIYFMTVASNGVGSEKNGFIGDYQIGVKKYFKVNKNIFFIGIGSSFRNNGTSYSYQEIAGYDPSGQPIYITGNSDFNFSTLDIPFGFHFQKLAVELMSSINFKNNFIPNNSLLLLALKLTYRLPLTR